MKRTIIGLRKNNGKYIVPTFAECLVDYFAKDSNSVKVNFSLENGTLILDESDDGYEFTHSPECPIKSISSGSQANSQVISKDKDDEIGVAASVVIESSDNCVLLTKRSSQLRTSPNVWVAPGGHIDFGETVFEAGVREVKEETGLNISEEKLSVLGLWENVYPLLLGLGPPKTHALIVYLYTRLNETSDELKKKLLSNPDEVESCCWMSASTLYKTLTQGEVSEQGKQYKLENGVMVEYDLDYNKMFNKWLWSQPKPYSGINFALKKWMQKIASNNPSSKI